MGFGLPILVNDQSLTMGTVMKLLYDVPKNSSAYLDPVFSRERRTASMTSRWDIYSLLEVTCDRYDSSVLCVINPSIAKIIQAVLDKRRVWSIV
jgi:hypothetical protein